MELYNEYELISHSKLADCSMFIVDMVYRPMHLHKEMELCYILSGTCRVSTDRQSFTAGAGGVLLFDAGAGHEIWAAGAPARILTLQLSHGFCSRFYPQIRNVRFGCRLLSDCLSELSLHTLQHAMLQAFSEYLLDSPQAMFACMAQIHAIFALLLQGVPYRVLSDTENTTQTRNAERMHRILHYLETHYSEPVRLSEIAKTEGLTQTYLSHLFREQLHIPFQEYLARLRLEAKLTDTMEFYAGGEVGVCTMPKKLLAAFTVTEDDLDSISGFARSIEGVRIGIMIREVEDGLGKISLRTEAPYDASAICQRLGGGGHAAAAGASVPGGIAGAKAAILRALAESGVRL